MLEHGGRLLRAVQHYGIPREQWLDLSSGIAPWSFEIPPIATQAWARLPEMEDGLEQAARTYYQVEHLLPVAGSQAAIQALPYLRRPGKVGVLSPCYAEHAHAWQRAGHALVDMDETRAEQALDSLDVLVVVNPNNPTGGLLSAQRLLDWHARLSRRGAWLVVDEAFMDMTPQHSIVGAAQRPGLIVLRSFGKFFGLAGVRLGFVVAQVSLLQRLAEWLGPWAISGPTRALAQACLLDTAAHASQKHRCAAASQRLARLLDSADLSPAGGCELFQYVRIERAARLHEFLARRGILVRLFEQPSALRLGLPATEEDWQRLGQALAIYQKESA
ncbi:threonine-phosphate decarboxylase [Pseudomonas capeferrum]|uniref:threonine-phosphate decarboxylase CobD n=1 Tax=Pseudomonas capeferrum TaxID=1495066 RepID=UPI0015E4051B|nr:threonine-phosphate decarboxylase CobD [Pseudomonas capeferrum]MBA1203796.1 threonine-phosphate decarboxylase [Pseudomonas capeferrum]